MGQRIGLKVGSAELVGLRNVDWSVVVNCNFAWIGVIDRSPVHDAVEQGAEHIKFFLIEFWYLVWLGNL